MTSKLASRLLVAFAAAAPLLAATGAGAFGPKAHTLLVLDARRFVPPELQRLLTQEEDALIEGALLPDTFLRDFSNQVYVPDRDRGGAPGKVAEQVERLGRLISKGAPPRKIARSFGTLSHYAADVFSPAGVRLGVTPTAAARIEAPLEELVEEARRDRRGLTVEITAYRPVADPAAALRRAALWTVENMGREGFWSAAYARAVHLVVDLWVRAWRLGGRDDGLTAPPGPTVIRSRPRLEPTPPPTPTPTLAERARQIREDRRRRGIASFHRDTTSSTSGGSSKAPAGGQQVRAGLTGDREGDETMEQIEERFDSTSRAFAALARFEATYDPETKTFRAEGVVENTGVATAKNVRVIIGGLNDQGEAVVTKEVYTAPRDIPFRLSGSFTAHIDKTDEIVKVEVLRLLWDNQ